MREAKPESRSVDRRSFLKLAGVGSGAAAISLAAGSDEAVAAKNTTRPGKAGYAETAHIRAYYASTRI